jgi:hypothetical protein
MSFEKSEKYQAARDSLPQELQPIFHQLVEEYAFQTHVKYGKGYVAYAVLAELVRAGWRPPETSTSRAEDEEIQNGR